MNTTILKKALPIMLATIALTACHSGMRRQSPSMYSDTSASGMAGNGAQTVPFNGQSQIEGSSSMAMSQKLRAPINQVYYFAFDKSRIHPSDLGSIHAQINYLLRCPKARVRIEGHTDQRGSREYNIALGWRRARAVSHLMLQAGVSRHQVIVMSYGKERPIALGHTAADYQKNRRVELIYERH